MDSAQLNQDQYNKNRFETAGQPANIEARPKDIQATKQRLKEIIADRNSTPEFVEIARKQLELLDGDNKNAQFVDPQLGKQPLRSAMEVQPQDAAISAELMNRVLRGDADLIKASEVGSPYKYMQSLIEMGKKRTKENKN